MEEVKITIQATPAELRYWASMLEDENCTAVTIRWYYTRLIIEKPSGVLQDSEEGRNHIHSVFEGTTHCLLCGKDISL